MLRREKHTHTPTNPKVRSFARSSCVRPRSHRNFALSLLCFSIRDSRAREPFYLLFLFLFLPAIVLRYITVSVFFGKIARSLSFSLELLVSLSPLRSLQPNRALIKLWFCSRSSGSPGMCDSFKNPRELS